MGDYGDVPASMGPPSEDDGKQDRDDRTAKSWRFNGAAVRGRRKGSVGRASGESHEASMGPPSEDDGK